MLIDQMHRNGKVEVAAPVAIYEAGAVIGSSTRPGRQRRPHVAGGAAAPPPPDDAPDDAG